MAAEEGVALEGAKGRIDPHAVAAITVSPPWMNTTTGPIYSSVRTLAGAEQETMKVCTFDTSEINVLQASCTAPVICFFY